LTNPTGSTFMRIYDQVSLRDHVKSKCFQRSDHRGDSAIGSSILLMPGAKFKQLFRGIQQSQRQDQLGITVFERAADLLKFPIYKGFNRLYSRSGSRAPNRKFPSEDCHCMACFHTMTVFTILNPVQFAKYGVNAGPESLTVA
jgi:hypothetical protein